MAHFQQMEQEIAAARHDLSQVSDTKAHVEQLFKDGFLFRQEDGSIAMPANDEVRQQVAESARKPAPGSKQHSAFLDSPAFGQGQ